MNETALLLPVLDQGKVLPHGGEGQENAIVGGVVVAVTDALHHADHLEANAVQQDGVADCRPPPGNRFFSISSPITATRRFWVSSS